MLLSCRLFPEEQKECRKGTKGTGDLLYIDQHILKSSKTRKEDVAMTWIDYEKPYDMVLQNWIIDSQKVQDIRLSHKVYRENHEKLESGIDSRRKKLSRGENPERNLPVRCTITITICKSDDSTQSQT